MDRYFNISNIFLEEEIRREDGLYKCELSTNTVTQVVYNSTLLCSEVNQVCTLNGKIVYTNAKAGKVKHHSVKVLVRSGHNSSSDGTLLSK